MASALDQISTQAISTEFTGQAVIDGVVMRSPRYSVIAIRRASNRILVRSFKNSRSTSLVSELPLIRGVSYLLDSFYIGIDALGFSAQVAAETSHSSGLGERSDVAGQWSVLFSLLVALILGCTLFILAPQLVARSLEEWMHWDREDHLFAIRASLAGVKVAVVLLYLLLMRLLPEIRKMFSYHWADHLALGVFEHGQEFNLKNAREQSGHHLYCPTSFTVVLVIACILFYSLALPDFGQWLNLRNVVFQHSLVIGFKVLLLLPIAGGFYELTRWASIKRSGLAFRLLQMVNWPLQRLLIARPSDAQIEVALVGLRQLLRLEKGVASPTGSQQVGQVDFKGDDASGVAIFEEEFEIDQLSDLGQVWVDAREYAMDGRTRATGPEK